MSQCYVYQYNVTASYSSSFLKLRCDPTPPGCDTLTILMYIVRRVAVQWRAEVILVNVVTNEAN